MATFRLTRKAREDIMQHRSSVTAPVAATRPEGLACSAPRKSQGLAADGRER
jgi:hypothetical protein